MMSQAITMITEIKTNSSENAFQDNDVIHLGRAVNSDECSLSAISWTTAGRSWQIQSHILKTLYTGFKSAIPEQNIWLFMGSYSWQPDNRITRHRRLWGSLKARGVEIFHGKDHQDHLIKGRKGIKFFGAINLSESSLTSTLSAILSERASYIVGLPKNCDISTFLNPGWAGKITEDINFICSISHSNGFVLKPIGEFDDAERGFVYLGPSDIARKISMFKKN